MELSPLQPIAKLFGLPKGGESLLIPAFLGGYPMGAQAISAAYARGQLKKEDASRMLAFCNNAGPAFLFGMIAPLLPEKWMAWSLWGIHIASALVLATVFPISSQEIEPSKQPLPSLAQSMKTSVAAVASVRMGDLLPGCYSFLRSVVSLAASCNGSDFDYRPFGNGRRMLPISPD